MATDTTIDALKSGTAQEILAVVIGLLLVALVWLVQRSDETRYSTGQPQGPTPTSSAQISPLPRDR